MPLTPLHLAAGLPLKKWISLKTFILVNIMIDVEPGLIMFFGMNQFGENLHQGVHTFGGVTVMAIMATCVAMSYKGSLKPRALGAALGAYSHLLLDALVHYDVNPFGPFRKGNPLFLDAYHEVSILCATVLIYYLAKWVESLRVGEVGPGWIRDTWRRFFPGSK